MKSHSLTLITLITLVMLTGCSTDQTAEIDTTASTPTVIATIPPIAGLVSTIAGPDTTVVSLLPAGADPHTFEPTPKQLMSLSDADLLIHAGMPMGQRLVGKITGSGLNVKVLALAGTHEHADEHNHDHSDEGHACSSCGSGNDPHIWLSPVESAKIVLTICDALSAQYPEGADSFSANRDDLLAALAAADAKASELLSPYAGKDVYVYHPAFSNFLARYKLNQIAIEDEGKAPTSRRLVEIMQQAKESGITTIFIQPQFDATAAQAIVKPLGMQIKLLDPMTTDLAAGYAEMAELVASSFAPVEND